MDPVSEGLTVRKTWSCPLGRCHSDIGIPAFWTSPFPKPSVIWASPVTLTLTLTQIAKVTWEGDAHMTRVLGINEDSHITVTTVVRACKSRQQTRKKGEHRETTSPDFRSWGPFLDRPGTRFSKVPIINGPDRLSPFTLKIEVLIVLHLTWYNYQLVKQNGVVC